MRLLLDTHAFLWWDANPEKLSQLAFDNIEAEANEIFLSMISIWEMQIKMQLGKLSLRRQLKEIVEQHKNDNDIQILSLSEEQIYQLNSLPHHHKDPFDRLLIAQSIEEALTFITDDPLIRNYSVSILW